MDKRFVWLFVRWAVFTVIVFLVSLTYSDDPYLERFIWAGLGGVLYILLFEGIETLRRSRSRQG